MKICPYIFKIFLFVFRGKICVVKITRIGRKM